MEAFEKKKTPSNTSEFYVLLMPQVVNKLCNTPLYYYTKGITHFLFQLSDPMEILKYM